MWRVCLVLTIVARLGTGELKVLFKRDVDDNTQLTFEMDDGKYVLKRGDEVKKEIQYEEESQGLQAYWRPGQATETNSCQSVRGIPTDLRRASYMRPSGLSYFYSKYTEAYGIPVISSSRVPDDALRRACYVLRFMMADHSGIRKSFYRYSGRVGVMAVNEYTNNIPEHSWLRPIAFWNARARGLGATVSHPISTGATENILCYSSGDKYSHEDIFLHEFAHGVHILGAAKAIGGWEDRLKALYRQTKYGGRIWANTYAMSTKEEYFAEAVQSYFYCNGYSQYPDGTHNHVNTREKLKSYDPTMYRLIQEVFPCSNTYIKRCEKSRAKEHAQVLRMNCNERNPKPNPKPDPRPDPRPEPPPPDCEDKNRSCVPWAKSGYCSSYAAYMNLNCKKSCNKCGGSCVDTDTSGNCSSWASRGECSKNPAYMHKSCKKSCNKC